MDIHICLIKEMITHFTPSRSSHKYANNVSKYSLLHFSFEELGQPCNILEILNRYDIDIMYIFVKREEDKYITTLLIEDLGTIFKNILSRCEVQDLKSLPEREIPDFILIDSKAITSSFKILIKEYGECAKLPIYS